jgi:orotidine-5'-phosphate decarboxylase
MDGFGIRARARLNQVGNPVVVGIDPHLQQLPALLRTRFEGRLHTAAGRRAAAEAVATWALPAVEALGGRVWGIKPQAAFFEQLGGAGVDVLEQVVRTARAAGLMVVLDAKRGDISSTAAAYAHATLHPEGPMAADAVTVNPWMGMDTLQPFLSVARAHGRGVFALLRTTNPGSALFQDYGSPRCADRLADAVAAENASDAGASLGVVVGAQAAAEAPALRARMPEAWFLVPGLGAQGGGIADALAGADARGEGVLPAAARSILFGPSGTPDPGADWVPPIVARAEALVQAVVRHGSAAGWPAYQSR